MPVSIQIGQAIGESIWQKLAIATAGPAVTAIVGSLAVGLMVAMITDRKRRKDADRSIREQLVMEMSQIASAFYFDLLQYRRLVAARQKGQGSPNVWAFIAGRFRFAEPPRKDGDRIAIDQGYRTFRLAADTLETRIEVYFADDDTREKWHAVSDLLTVRFYDSVGELTDLVLRNNAKGAEKQHSGLTKDELRDAKLLVRTYKASLKRAIRAVMTDQRYDGDRPAARTRTWFQSKQPPLVDE